MSTAAPPVDTPLFIADARSLKAAGILEEALKQRGHLPWEGIDQLRYRTSCQPTCPKCSPRS